MADSPLSFCADWKDLSIHPPFTTPGDPALIMTPNQLCHPAAALWVLLATLVFLFAQAAAAADLRGRVVGITDGDTLTLLTDRREAVRIRLAEIDTPERGQPYGSRARQSL
jgi:endonuclease YncB( thermonuclease family)